MEPVDQVTQLTEGLLQKLEIVGSVSVVTDETGAYRVNIQTEETGLLIGYHGRTLESLQIILGIMASRKLNQWIRVYVNVGDYREKREETLMLMAQRAAERVAQSGNPVELSRLSPSERRVVHMTLSGDERVTTESIGERDDRVLIIKPR